MMRTFAITFAFLLPAAAGAQDYGCFVSNDQTEPEIQLYDKPNGNVIGAPWPGAELVVLRAEQIDDVVWLLLSGIRTQPANEAVFDGYVGASHLDCDGVMPQAGKIKKHLSCTIMKSESRWIDYLDKPGGQTMLKIAGGTSLSVSEFVEKDGVLYAWADAYLDTNPVGYALESSMELCDRFEPI